MRILMIFLLVASPKTLGLCFVLALAPDWSTGSFLADIGDVAAFSAPTVENLGELDTTMKSSPQKDEIDGNNPTAAEINDITIPSQSTDLMSGNLEIPNADLVSESAKVQAIPSSPNSHGKFCKTLSGNSRRAIKLRGELCECLKVEVLCPPPKFTMNNFIWWETLCCVGEIGPYNTFVDDCWKYLGNCFRPECMDITKVWCCKQFVLNEGHEVTVPGLGTGFVCDRNFFHPESPFGHHIFDFFN